MAEKLKLDDWYYRGEGHCSLVLANTKENVVIRLLKRKKREQNNKKQKTECDAHSHVLQRGTGFVQHVIQPLLGDHYVKFGEPIDLTPSFLEDVNKKVEACRPAHRLGKEVDPDCPLGIKLPDFCHVSPCVSNCDTPTFCVEIKTKCGFMPSSDNVPEARSVKTRVCAYCMYQHLKLKLGKWPERSEYCPVDLFSGNTSRMKYALKSLFKTPQNNLRLFKNGEVLLSEEIREDYWDHLKPFIGRQGEADEAESIIETFQDFIVNCLLHVPETQINGEAVHQSEQPVSPGERLSSQSSVQHCKASGYCQQTENNNGDSAAAGLPSGCVLQKLLAAQKLDDLGIEGIWPLYERVTSHFNSTELSREKSFIDGPYEHFWLKQPASNPCIKDQSALDSCLCKVKEYMVSRTAKDCSVMIAVRPLTQSENGCEDQHLPIVSDRHGNQFQLSIAIIDLDAKPIEKFTTYLEDDRTIVEYYMKIMDGQNNAK